MKAKIFGGMVVAAMLALGISNSAFAAPGCHPHAGFYVGINGALGSVGFSSGGYAPAYYRPVPPPPPAPVVVPVPVYQGGYYGPRGYNVAYNGYNNGYHNGCGHGYYPANGCNNRTGYYHGYRR